MFEELNSLLQSAQNVELPEEGEFTELPEGEYKAVIDNIQFKESKAGNLMCEWEFIIDEGDYSNRHHWKYNVLNSPENMKRLLTELAKFGVDTTTMESIEKGFTDMINVPVTLEIKKSVSKKTGTEFTNTHVNPIA